MNGAQINGIIVVDKPAGWTSHDVVAKLRGALKVKRAGHGGTLDPMATGVLPVFVGRATRAASFCENADKEYVAGIRFGLATDTQDTGGKTLSERTPSFTAAELQDVIQRFRGAQKQLPPMYSAIKIGGKKLYESARRGIEVDRPPRDVFISEIALLDPEEISGGDPRYARGAPPCVAGTDYQLRIVCSKGTYIRTLCHDVGAELGCGAAMSSLRRTRAGVFAIDAAHTLDEVLAAARSGETARLIRPVDTIFSKYPAVKLTVEQERKCRNGAPCKLANTEDGTYRFYGAGEEFVLLGEVTGGALRIVKSFFAIVP